MSPLTLSNEVEPQTYIYSMLDAVPPIHAESSHVATDKDPSK